MRAARRAGLGSCAMVLPIYDDNPFKLPHRPVMTWSLIGVNFLVFLLELGLRQPATAT